MRLAFLASFVLAISSPYRVAQSFFTAPTNHLRGTRVSPSHKWYTSGGILFYESLPFWLKGINFHGMESDCRVPHGLWKNSLTSYLDVLQNMSFNAIRVPLSYEIMSDFTTPVNNDCLTADTRYYGSSTKDFLTSFLDECHQRGIFILLDLHTIGSVITPLPWTDQVSEDQVIDAWVNTVRIFGSHSAVMGIEIKNEPHGECTLSQFVDHSVRVIRAIEDRTDYDRLYFVSGVQKGQLDYNNPWGGTYEGSGAESGLASQQQLVDLNTTSRIVVCPHIYGPDVRGVVAMSDTWMTFDRRFGFIRDLPAPWNEMPVIPTEVGGNLVPGTDDFAYFVSYRGYMQNRNFSAGSFWWTFPETSADTGGLLTGDAWVNVDSNKAGFLESMQPHPTIISDAMHRSIVG